MATRSRLEKEAEGRAEQSLIRRSILPFLGGSSTEGKRKRKSW